MPTYGLLLFLQVAEQPGRPGMTVDDRLFDEAPSFEPIEAVTAKKGLPREREGREALDDIRTTG
jgi:hypothetical protein